MRCQKLQLGRFFARSILMLLLISMPLVIEYGPIAAQDEDGAAIPTEEISGDEVTDPSVDPPPASFEVDPPAETEIDPVDESAEQVDETVVETEADPIEGEATAEVPPPPPTPTLAFDPTSAPDCIPVSGDPSEAVADGGDLALTCTYVLALDGNYVDPASIVLDWSVSASVGGDWGVQLLDPTGDPSAWTDPGVSSAALGFQTAYSYDTSVGPLESLQDVAAIQFGLRLHRPVCMSDPVTLEVDVIGSASIPSSDQAVVTSNTAQPLVATFAPSLADLDSSLPVVSIVDVAVDPVAFSLTDSQAYGTLTIQVDNPTLQCQQSNVLVAIQSSTGSAIADAAYLSGVGLLDASSVAGAVPDTSGEGNSLDSYVIVSSVQVHAEAGSYQQTIDFEVTIPGATVVGSYQLSASAVVEPAE